MLAGGSGSQPRMASSVWSDERNCHQQTMLMVTALPSYPARSWRRPVDTAPLPGFAVLSGLPSVDGKWSTACDY